MRKSTVSVVIPSYNAARWIQETIQSVLSQRVKDVEIIVVDDGSTDETPRIVESEFPSVRLMRSTHRGASGARNVGTAEATGEFIQYVDADDVLAPGKIQKQIELLQTSLGDVAYGDWQRLVPDGLDNFARGEVVVRRMKRTPDLELFGNFWCPPAVYLFRRSIVDKVGKWNERLPVIQDARFALDCALHGATFAYCSGIVAYYRNHSEGSLSKRDPVAFVRDVHVNALEVEAWWQQHGGLTAERKDAVIGVLAYVARSSYERDPSTFEAVHSHLEKLRPGFVPDRPQKLAVISRLVGYRRAEALAWAFRRMKRTAKHYWCAQRALLSGTR